MTSQPIAIVITTAGRGALLARTLESIADARLPQSVSRIIVAENGPKGPAEETLRPFLDRLPILHQYTAPPNKCHALNEALSRCDKEFVVFFDDDIRIETHCLEAYASTIAELEPPFFLGGRCEMDFEDEPPEWLKAFLPTSAKRWSLGNERVSLNSPDALGFNFGAFARDVKRLGGFNPAHGPGNRHPVGDETGLQKRMLSAGIKGYFVPEAIVWHNVPRDRCSPPWALKRAVATGYIKGIWLLEESPQRRNEFVTFYRKRLRKFTILSSLLPYKVWPQRFFRYRYYKHLTLGYMEAFQATSGARGH